MNQIVTIELNSDLKEKLISHYGSIKRENKGEYILFFGKDSKLTVTVYTSKKSETYKTVFIGANALEEAKKWDANAVVNEPKEKKAPAKAAWEILSDQIGSDEVGTGDFFGPICVCAAYVREKDIPRLKELGVDDSKRLTDAQIKKLGKILIKEFEYSQLSLNNEKYNELVDAKMNMNEMKAKMHNRVLLNLHKKHCKVKNILIDEFLSEDKYYKYLKNEKDVVKGLEFKTKGETYFPSVAVGSIIARYSFIQHMELINKKYGVDIPYGASTKVTNFAKDFIEKFGIAELDKIVKKNFANYKDLTKLI